MSQHIRYPGPVEDQWPRWLAEHEEEVWGDQEDALCSIRERPNRWLRFASSLMAAIGAAGLLWVALVFGGIE